MERGDAADGERRDGRPGARGKCGRDRERESAGRRVRVSLYLYTPLYNRAQIGFEWADPLTEADIYNMSASENRLINRGSHVIGERLC